jgi:hypothetical protein
MADVLAKQPRPKGPRLTIVTNAGGPGVLAADALIENGGKLADLSPETLKELNTFLPAPWSHGNPVDVLGDADAARYGRAVEAAAADANSDGTPFDPHAPRHDGRHRVRPTAGLESQSVGRKSPSSPVGWAATPWKRAEPFCTTRACRCSTIPIPPRKSFAPCTPTTATSKPSTKRPGPPWVFTSWGWILKARTN